jgi:hypothetical protein
MKSHNNYTNTIALAGSGVAVLLTVMIAVGGAVGWVRNVIAVAHSDFHAIDGELVIRAIGIPMVPVGAVMGWVP